MCVFFCFSPFFPAEPLHVPFYAHPSTTSGEMQFSPNIKPALNGAIATSYAVPKYNIIAVVSQVITVTVIKSGDDDDDDGDAVIL